MPGPLLFSQGNPGWKRTRGRGRQVLWLGASKGNLSPVSSHPIPSSQGLTSTPLPSVLCGFTLFPFWHFNQKQADDTPQLHFGNAITFFTVWLCHIFTLFSSKLEGSSVSTAGRCVLGDLLQAAMVVQIWKQLPTVPLLFPRIRGEASRCCSSEMLTERWAGFIVDAHCG